MARAARQVTVDLKRVFMRRSLSCLCLPQLQLGRCCQRYGYFKAALFNCPIPSRGGLGSVDYLPLSLCIKDHARHFTFRVYEQHIDRRFKELTLHALCQHRAIPMSLLLGAGVYSETIRDPYRSIDVSMMGITN